MFTVHLVYCVRIVKLIQFRRHDGCVVRLELIAAGRGNAARPPNIVKEGLRERVVHNDGK